MITPQCIGFLIKTMSASMRLTPIQNIATTLAQGNGISLTCSSSSSILFLVLLYLLSFLLHLHLLLLLSSWANVVGRRTTSSVEIDDDPEAYAFKEKRTATVLFVKCVFGFPVYVSARNESITELVFCLMRRRFFIFKELLRFNNTLVNDGLSLS